MKRTRLKRKGRVKVLDKFEFLNHALNAGYEMGDIQDFIADEMQNLRSLKWNMKRLKQWVKMK